MMHKAFTVLSSFLALTLTGDISGDISNRMATVISSDRIVEIGRMGSARAAHTMTALQDGRILVVGGMAGEQEKLGETSIYNPATKTFTPLPSGSIDRQSHTATLLHDGRVLITGGFDSRTRQQNSTYLFDASTGTFSIGPTLPTVSTGQTATLLDDGRVILIGGKRDNWQFISEIVAFDPTDDSIKRVGQLSTARGSHTASLLPGGKILVVGGHTGPRRNLDILRSAEIFDPATGETITAGSMNIRRHKHDAVVLRNGSVLIVGGADERDSRGTYDSTEIFDPELGRFRKDSNLINRRYKHRGTSITLHDGRVLFAGGSTSPEVRNSKGTNRILGPENLRGQFSAATILDNGSVLITGGYGSGQGPTDQAWLFIPGK